MADDGVRVQAQRWNGTCLLRISGELDMVTADELGERADTAVLAVPGAVLVDLSGLTFIDAHAARVLNAVIRTLPEGRPASVRSCPRGIRRALDLLGLSLDGPPAGYAADPQPGIPALAGRVRQARLNARESRLAASGTLARLTDTCIRVASTIERAALIQEQGRQAQAASRATREYVIRSRQAARAGAAEPSVRFT